MIGMNATTGSALGGGDHIAQSIADILTTPIGTRVGRREYGSRLFDLIDAPFVRGTQLLAYAAIALAVNRWEPRVRLDRVTIDRDAGSGAAIVNLTGTRLDLPEPVAAFTAAIPLNRLSY